ncbi:GNAT family N-acetyltransferase [Bordetella pertussis]|uniref:Acetyltransferase n=18 Tax=Bordetella TaxID=517 RepID=A0A0T7CTF2_BORP1|nr:GNAT family N-acetyltransferase [Bordetella pertussis]AZR86327.1 acetyltransferase [Bordetella pertussis]PNO99098.1 GNAT family N-acetyltransferase [Bordetella pertussis 18323]UEB57269.1 GNAT family N-acetyltransferase [Bordetella pertussis]CCJ64841.1 putative acetyltransferase [Bordetella pertussis 18323]
MPQSYIVRTMRPADVEAVLRVQAAVYPASLLESAALFQNRIEIAPATCQVALDGQDLIGYLIAYPWDAGLPPALDRSLERLPGAADTWFVHDCAVLPAAQGGGVAAALLAGGRAQARRLGLRRASLVALAQAVGYWLRHGYQPLADSDALRAKLAGYGDGARYMVRADLAG